MSSDLAEIKRVVESWCIQRGHGREFNQRDLFQFVSQMNYYTKKLLRAYAEQYRTIEFFTKLQNTASDAESLTRKGSNLRNEGIVGVRLIAAQALIRQHRVYDSEYYVGLMELALHAQTLLANARVIADGVEVSSD